MVHKASTRGVSETNGESPESSESPGYDHQIIIAFHWLQLFGGAAAVPLAAAAVLPVSVPMHTAVCTGV